MSQYIVAALYKFVSLPHFESLRQPLLKILLQQKIKGTLLLAHEGINGTISGSQESINQLLVWFNQHPPLDNIQPKYSLVNERPFYRTKVKLKKEIVTMGVEDIDPTKVVGTYVKPENWNSLISDPEVFVVDTRNEYEIGIGTFEHAVNPHTQSFREFPDYVEKTLDRDKHKKIAMFCTGGIRCEKSTAYLKEQGFPEVYHLEGGILNYLEKIPEKQSLWRGECFVFDNRVTVKHTLEQGDHEQCFACRMPILLEDKLKPEFVAGVSCHHCYAQTSSEQKARFAEREKQSQLSKARNEIHIGAEAQELLQQRKLAKQQHKQQQRLIEP